MLRTTAAMVMSTVMAGSIGLSRAEAQPVLPDFSAATFEASSAQLTHPYFYPSSVGKAFRYEAQVTDPDTGEVETEVVIVEVLDQTRTVAGIESRVIRDRVFVEGLLIEDTFDWYAQDTEGNVWYMGEDVTDFEYDDDGNVIDTTHDGAWETGVDGALPGYIMPATPMVGDHYYQEFFEGEAEDSGLILSIDETFTLEGFGELENIIRTRDFSLDPSAFEEKLYAPGIGPIAEFGFDALGAQHETLLLKSVVVPEPGTALMTLGGWMVLTGGARHGSKKKHPSVARVG